VGADVFDGLKRRGHKVVPARPGPRRTRSWWRRMASSAPPIRARAARWRRGI